MLGGLVGVVGNGDRLMGWGGGDDVRCMKSAAGDNRRKG